MTDESTPIPVQILMTAEDFLSLSDNATQWGPWEGEEVEEGRYEPVGDDRETVSLEWTTAQYFMTRADMILAKSYLTAIGEPFECLYDTASLPEPEDEEPEKWAGFVILHSADLIDWGTATLLCPSCNTPSGVHWQGCPYYDSLKETMPGLDDPIEERWRGAKTATIGAALEDLSGDGDED